MQPSLSKETKLDKRSLRLLFLLSRFLDGGIDTVLLEYVNHLADHLHYDVTLGIAICYGDLEVYRPKLSPCVKVVYFNQSPFLTRIARQRICKKYRRNTMCSPEKTCHTKRHLQAIATDRCHH